MMRIKFIQKLIDKIRGKQHKKQVDVAERYNDIIKQYRFVHLMFNDKFGKPWVDFLNKNFDTKEHLVLCKKWFDEFPFPYGENVVKIESLQGMDFSSVEKIFCHSLFDEELVEYLYEHQDILRYKAYWMIWGGDLYDAKRDEKNDFVRENFRGYITLAAQGDKAVLQKIYNITENKEFYHAGYAPIITQEMVDEVKQSLIPQNATIIQINNSCDKSTLEMLEILSRFKNENIIIKTILSYGNLDFKEKIIKKGREIFGEKFTFIDTILSPQDYAKYTSENNVFILNQNRQQGVGNACLALQFGSKLYIRSEISSFNHLIANGNVVFDASKITQMDFEEFIFIDKTTQENNIKESSKFFSIEVLKNSWEKIF